MNSEYWESKFKEEGAMWKFEPSDSALLTLDLFKSNHIRNILIPGVGYGRNAKLFYDNGFNVTGIEISQSAINLAKENGLNFTIHHGSVLSMPFDNSRYEGIFCYALIHLLNNIERKAFLLNCYNQLAIGGIMVFTVATTQMSMYGSGKKLSKNRFEIMKGLNVYFYDRKAIEKEFSPFGLIEYREIDEPIKHLEGYAPLKLEYVICKKQ